jgi:hypothetical protein
MSNVSISEETVIFSLKQSQLIDLCNGDVLCFLLGRD